MERTRHLFDLRPEPGTHATERRILAEGRDIVLRYVVDDTEKGEVVFPGGVAYRWTRSELCTPEMVDAYDSVAEVLDSEWSALVTRAAEVGQTGARTPNLPHYRVYFDGGGCYEILAESASLRESGTTGPAA